MNDLPPRKTRDPGPAPSIRNALRGHKVNGRYEVDDYVTTDDGDWIYAGRALSGEGSGRQVTIRILSPDRNRREDVIAELSRAIAALASVGASALARYREFGFDAELGIHYIVRDNLGGTSLGEALTGKPVPEPEARAFLRRMAIGLEAAHAAGVLHLNLSPDVIQLPDGKLYNAVVTDFALSAKLESPARDVFAGKETFAAPEALRPARQPLGTWSDVYALGLVTAAVARGEPLSMGGSRDMALRMRSQVPDLSGIDQPLRGVLEAMLQPDHGQRLPDMVAVLDAMASEAPEAPSRHEPVTVTDVTVLPGRAVRTTQGGSARTGLIAAGVAAAVALGGLGLWLSSSGGGAAGAAQSYAAELRRLPCSDLRAERIEGNRIVVRGWRPSDTPLPAAPAGVAVDDSDVAALLPPLASTCKIWDEIKASNDQAPLSLASSALLAEPDPGGCAPEIGGIPVVDDRSDRSTPICSSVTVPLASDLNNNVAAASVADVADIGDDKVATIDDQQIGTAGVYLPYNDRKFARYLVIIMQPTNPGERLSQPRSAEGRYVASFCQKTKCRVGSVWVTVRPDVANR